MGLREKIENHPVVVFLSTLVIGFVAGVGTYQATLEIAHLEVVPKSSVAQEPTSVTAAVPAPQEQGKTIEQQPPNSDFAPAARSTIQRDSEPTAAASPENHHTQVVRGIEFRLAECDGTADCVVCDVLATALEEDREIVFHAMSVNGKRSRAVDPKGHELHPARIGFGPRLFMADKMANELVQGIPLSLRLEICDGGTAAELALLEVSVEDDRGPFRVPFRDVAVHGR